MGYPKGVYDRAWDRLQQKAQAAQREAAVRRETIDSLLPEIRQIERGMARTAAQVAKAIVAQPDRAKEQVEQLRRENLALQQRRRELLTEKGFPPDYLAEIYGCRECHDKGYIGTRMCNCLQKLLKQEAYEQLGAVSGADAYSFDGFRLDYYPTDEGGNSPREVMAQVLAVCRGYASGFSTVAESLLLLGPTGLGKTHLSLAIASEVICAGFGVVYTPVQRLVDRLESEKFARGGEGRYLDAMGHVLECDLLVLDDLGTEFHTQFTSALLYNIINSRLVEGRPTIISTNLELSQIEDKYSQRMVSRLICSYRVLRFFGKDIRYMKKSKR